MSKVDRKNGVPTTLTTIPLADPHAGPPSRRSAIWSKTRPAQMSTLVRAEVELASAEITRDVKKGLTGSVFFIAALVVLFYSTFFFFFFSAELLDNWLWRWAAFLIVFAHHGADHRGLLALFGYPEGPPHPRAAADHRVRQGNARPRSRRATTGPCPAREGEARKAITADGAKPTDPTGW